MLTGFVVTTTWHVRRLPMERTAFQIGPWRAASRYKKNPSRTYDRGWASILEFGMGSNNPHRDRISTCEMTRMVWVNSLKKGVRLWAGLIRLRDRGQLADSCENDRNFGAHKSYKRQVIFLNNW